ncbi:hypothetical protein ACKVCY_19500 [Escherichia coli]
MSASAKSYVARPVIIGVLLLLAGLCVAAVLALLNIAGTQEKQLSQFDQRLQAVEMTMADSVTNDGMNAQLDTLRQELATLKQRSESQSDTLRTVTAQLAVATKPDEQSAVLEKRLAQLETRLAQWAPALHQLQEQRQPVQKTVNSPVVRAKPATPGTSRTGASVTSSRRVPFQLTAIELRGGRLLAALAPADIHHLGQVTVTAGGRALSGLGNDRHSDRPCDITLSGAHGNVAPAIKGIL